MPKNKRYSLKGFALSSDELSKAFTSQRSSRAKNYFNQPKFRSAYLLYFFLQTYEKVLFCLNKSIKLGFKIDNVLDLGSGPGPAAIAALNLGSKSVTLVDQNKKSLNDARFLIDKLYNSTKPNIIVANAEKCKFGNRFDTILAVNFFNEVKKENRVQLVKNLSKHTLSKNGVIIIIEPALRFITRDLMKLRDDLINENLFIHAPCLHQHRCPMSTTNNRDWCHYYLNWQQPEIIQNMDKIIHRNHKYLKLSYMIISTNPPKPIRGKALVVSSPLISKGKTELLICSSSGKIKRMRQLQRSGDSNFKKLTRGDIIEENQP